MMTANVTARWSACTTAAPEAHTSNAAALQKLTNLDICSSFVMCGRVDDGPGQSATCTARNVARRRLDVHAPAKYSVTANSLTPALGWRCEQKRENAARMSG